MCQKKSGGLFIGIILMVFMILIFFGCAADPPGSLREVSDDSQSPLVIPKIISLSPDAAVEGEGPLLLTVTGENFFTDSTIIIDDIEQETDCISDNELSCRVDFETMKSNDNVNQKKEMYHLYRIRVENSDGQISSPHDWPVCTLRFDWKKSRLMFDVGSIYLNWDMELDDQNGVHVVLEKFTVPDDEINSRCLSDLRIISSFDDGLTWNDPVLIKKNIKGYYDSDSGLYASLDMTIDNQGNIFIAYDETDRQYIYDFGKIKVVCSTDRGKTWKRKVVYENDSGVGLGQIESVKNQVFLTFSDGQCHLVSSTDGGETWDPLLRETGQHARIGYHSENNMIFFVVSNFLFDRNDYIRTSIDEGMTWTSPADLPENISVNRVVFGPNDVMHVVSADLKCHYDMCMMEYFYRNSTDYGKSLQNVGEVSYDHVVLDRFGLIYAVQEHLHVGNLEGTVWFSIDLPFSPETIFKSPNEIRIDGENNIHLLYPDKYRVNGEWRSRIFYTRSK
jgi:hypothetical protein